MEEGKESTTRVTKVARHLRIDDLVVPSRRFTVSPSVHTPQVLYMPRRPIKCVIFDFGGVIGYSGKNDYIMNQVKQYEEGFYQFTQCLEKAWRIFHKGDCTECEFWNMLIRKSSFLKIIRKGEDFPTENDPEVLTEYFSKKIRDTFYMYKELNPMMEIMKRNGILMGICSNQAREWFEHGLSMNPKLEELIHPELYVVSSYVKHQKPNRDMYLYLFKQIAKIDPSITVNEIVLVDDKPSNIKGIQQMGVKNAFAFDARFDRSDELRAHLFKLCGLENEK